MSCSPFTFLPQEIIRRKRDGEAIPAAALTAFVTGLVEGRVSEGQAAAFAMAVFFRGLNAAERVALTQAMARSGTCLTWDVPGPVVDKHSTGGVGDAVSLILAPLAAACGLYVPMIAGRGLGHTGGTLDKLSAIPGYALFPAQAVFQATVRQVGCAIIGATDAIAPADRRLYAIRDVTATVESLDLIVASILAKKLAAGVQGLVMDVKYGNGAFLPQRSAAEALAAALVTVAHGAGLPVVTRLTAMDCVLARSAGNALEVQEALDLLCGRPAAASALGRPSSRLWTVTRELAVAMLMLGGVAADPVAAEARIAVALDSGAAAERFARMVVALGGPADLLEHGAVRLPQAAVQRPVFPAVAHGRVVAMDTRALGLVVVALGGGRTHPQGSIDPAVGLAAVAAPGEPVGADQPLAVIHAASADAAAAAAQAVLAAFQVEACG